MNQVKVERLITTRGLPKTGQTVSYHSGDDGVYEAGWWQGTLNANNKTRFVAKTIGGDDIVLDKATGLIWAADGNAGGCAGGDKASWESAFTQAIELSFAGFTDWRLPNIHELHSIVNFEKYNPAIDTNFFPNTYGDDYWTSTTNSGDESDAYWVDFLNGIVLAVEKSTIHYMRFVRGGV